MRSRPERLSEHSSPVARVQRWLLRQIPAADGAVIGSFEPDGRPRYAYPEIAGYALSWLAWLQSCADPAWSLHKRAAAVGVWLQHWLDSDLRTRPSPGAAADWRNQGLFAFDLAMILRGVAAARSASLMGCAEAKALTAGLAAQLVRLLDNHGELMPVLVTGDRLPDRWSTRSGPYQAKVGAALLLAQRQLTIPAVLTRAADQLLRDAATQIAGPIHTDSAHAALYALEGIAQGVAIKALPEATLVLLPQRLDDLAQAPGMASHERHDVLAQWVRLARLYCPDHPRLPELIVRLEQAVTDTGALPFAQLQGDPGPCTWAALFCHQALNPQTMAMEHCI